MTFKIKLVKVSEIRQGDWLIKVVHSHTTAARVKEVWNDLEAGVTYSRVGKEILNFPTDDMILIGVEY